MTSTTTTMTQPRKIAPRSLVAWTTKGRDVFVSIDETDAHLVEVGAAAGFQVATFDSTGISVFVRVASDPKFFAKWETFACNVEVCRVDTVAGINSEGRPAVLAAVGDRINVRAKVRQDRTLVTF